MKNNGTSFTYGVFIIVCALIIAMLVVAVTEPAGAQSINYREWLLEYEQVDAYIPPVVRPLATFLSGYPAPPVDVEPTVTYGSGYPAPPIEPTATKEPKPKKKDPNCLLEPTDAWWREMRLGQAYHYMKDNVKMYCFGYPPIPFYEGKTVPTPAPTMNPYDGSGYPAPIEEPIITPGNGYPAPTESGYPAPTEETPESGYPAPGVNP
jgi:hypothetical protein